MKSPEGQPNQQPEQPRIYSKEDLVKRLKDIREVAESSDPIKEAEKRIGEENVRLATRNALEEKTDQSVTEIVPEKPQPVKSEILESHEKPASIKKKTQPLTSAAAYALWQEEQERKQNEGNDKGL
jgi:hypothetical protein